MFPPTLGRRLKNALLSAVSASAVTAMPAAAQSTTVSSPDKNEAPVYSLLLERSSHLLRKYDTLLAAVPLGSAWTLQGMVYDAKDSSSAMRIIGLGAKGTLGKTSISASVSAPKEAIGDALVSISADHAYGDAIVGVQATRAGGSADTTFVRANARRGRWDAAIFAGKNTTFGTKGLPEEILLPLPIPRLLGTNTLIGVELAENTIEKRVLGASIGYARGPVNASAQYRRGTQYAGFLDDERFTAVETSISYDGNKNAGRLETGVRMVTANRYANALFETRLLTELERKGETIEAGVGAYLHGFGDSVSSCIQFRDAFGAAAELRVRTGESWYGLRTHVDQEGMRHHTVLRIAGTLRTHGNEFIIGARRDTNGYDANAGTIGGFIGYQGRVGKRLSLDGELGYADERPYGTLALTLRSK